MLDRLKVMDQEGRNCALRRLLGDLTVAKRCARFVILLSGFRETPREFPGSLEKGNESKLADQDYPVGLPFAARPMLEQGLCQAMASECETGSSDAVSSGGCQE